MSDQPQRNKIYISAPKNLLKPLIMQELHDYGKQTTSTSSGGSYQRLPHYVKGKIYIKLLFDGIITNTKDYHKTEKSFRLMKDDPATISEERLNQLGNIVKTKFNNFSFTTGRESYTYNDPEVGFNRIWGYFNTQADAMRLFEQMLDIVSASPDWKKLSHSRVVVPGNRFAEPPEKVLQSGVSIRSARERPFSTQKFKGAMIKFPHVRQEIEFVNQFMYINNVHKVISALAAKD